MAEEKIAVNGGNVRTQARTEARAEAGLRFRRYFTSEGGVSPFDAVEWERRGALISNEKGQVIFSQDNIEVPKSWSQTATNVVVAKYFRGPLGTHRRETSVRQLVLRVVDTISGWGEKQGYFANSDARETFRAELTHLLVNQKASFNSPVYFNVGIDPKPQCSACFILKVDDSMESILNWYRNEGMIFKGGSGAGVNLSALRSCREKLSSGGTASGPLSFMKAADASAGVIKSGGKTRRAAKMVVLDVDHPDVVDFIKCKEEEERKAWALIDAGYDSSLDGPAYGSVFFQNANNSVRVSDEFMRAAVADLVPRERRGVGYGTFTAVYGLAWLAGRYHQLVPDAVCPVDGGVECSRRDARQKFRRPVLSSRSRNADCQPRPTMAGCQIR